MPTLFDPKAEGYEPLNNGADFGDQKDALLYSNQYRKRLMAEREAAGIPEPHLIPVKHRKTKDFRMFNVGYVLDRDGNKVVFPGAEQMGYELLKGPWRMLSQDEYKAELAKLDEYNRVQAGKASDDDARKASDLLSKAFAGIASAQANYQPPSLPPLHGGGVAVAEPSKLTKRI